MLDQPLPPRKAEPSERELRAMLEGRDRQIDAKLKNQGRILSRILPVLFVAFLAWAGYVYVVSERAYTEAEAATAAGKPTQAAAVSPPPGQMSANPLSWAGAGAGANTSAPAPVDPNNILTTPTSPKLEHSDIHFAMELFNYVHPAKPQEPSGQTQQQQQVKPQP